MIVFTYNGGSFYIDFITATTVVVSGSYIYNNQVREYNVHLCYGRNNNARDSLIEFYYNGEKIDNETAYKKYAWFINHSLNIIQHYYKGDLYNVGARYIKEKG